MRSLVTGGAGFIGSHLADALVARGDDVVIVDDLSSGKREQVPAGAELVVRDIRSGLDDLFRDAGAEVCFHLAAQMDVRVSVARPDFDAEVNVLGTVRVLEAARASRARVIFASTGGAIYGECERPAREDDELRPIAPYGVSKLAGEEYLAAYGRLYGAGHVSLRYGNVYGPRQNPHGEAGVVAIFFERLSNGERPRVFGDGRQTRDYVHVEDIVKATLAAERVAGGVFNVGTGLETTVLDLLAACLRAAGSETEPEFAPERLGELERSVLDPARAERELGWRPEWTLEDGLRQTWKWAAGQEG